MGLRVLVVLPRPPRREGGAADRCAIGLVQGLRANGTEVKVFALDPDGTGADSIDGVEVELLVEPRRRDVVARARNLWRPHVGLASAAAVRRLSALAESVDAVHLEQVETGWLGATLAAPKTLHVQYRSRLDQDLGAVWGHRFRIGLEARRVERSMIRRYPDLVANSDVVAATLRAEAPRGRSVTVVPLTLDPSDYPAATPAPSPIAGILGTASWPPTADAVDALLDRVWPQVRLVVGDATLRVGGRGTSRWADRCGLGVEIVGEVESATRFLGGLGVLVYPVSRGSGMKVKVLEALAMGIPIVTTRSGAEGLAATDGIIIADDDRTFAAATADLLRDEEARRQRGAAARRTFFEHHAPAVAAASLVAALQQVAEVTSGGSAVRRR